VRGSSATPQSALFSRLWAATAMPLNGPAVHRRDSAPPRAMGSPLIFFFLLGVVSDPPAPLPWPRPASQEINDLVASLELDASLMQVARSNISYFCPIYPRLRPPPSGLVRVSGRDQGTEPLRRCPCRAAVGPRSASNRMPGALDLSPESAGVRIQAGEGVCEAPLPRNRRRHNSFLPTERASPPELQHPDSGASPNRHSDKGRPQDASLVFRCLNKEWCQGNQKSQAHPDPVCPVLDQNDGAYHG
jgi:hypothetical protein